MNEEERKAVEILNTFELRRKTKNYKEISLEDSQSVKIVLNLIKKLQKENEELKENNNKYTIHLTDKQYNAVIENAQNDINQKWIQKVKENIEKLNDDFHAEELEDIMIGGNYTITELVQYVLQELIEEREEE